MNQVSDLNQLELFDFPSSGIDLDPPDPIVDIHNTYCPWPPIPDPLCEVCGQGCDNLLDLGHIVICEDCEDSEAARAQYEQ